MEENDCPRKLNTLNFKKKAFNVEKINTLSDRISSIYPNFCIKENYCNFERKKYNRKLRIKIIQFYDTSRIRENIAYNCYRIVTKLTIINCKIIKPNCDCNNFFIRHSYHKIPEVLNYNEESDDWYRSSGEEENSDYISINDSVTFSSSKRQSVNDESEISGEEEDSAETSFLFKRTPEKPYLSTMPVSQEVILEHKYFQYCTLKKTKLTDENSEVFEKLKLFIQENKNIRDITLICKLFNVQKTNLVEKFILSMFE